MTAYLMVRHMPVRILLAFLLAGAVAATGCARTHAPSVGEQPSARAHRPGPLLSGSLPDVELAVAAALKDSGLGGRVVRIAADTNGRIVVAGVWFDHDTEAANPLPGLQAFAAKAVRSAFAAIPNLDELHLSALYQNDPETDVNRRDVLFSLAVSRREAGRIAAGNEAAAAVAALPRSWYHKALQQAAATGTAVVEKPRSHPPLNRERRPAYQGDARSQSIEAGHRTTGLASGGPIDGKIYRFDPSRRVMALTFDDGPIPIYTTLLLDTLEHLNLRATMFLIGHRAQQYPFFARDITRRGHEVANHTFHHVNLTRLTVAGVADEIAGAQDVISTVTGQTPRYFRPPGGDYNNTVLRVANNLGLITVFWTDDPADYARLGPKELEARLLSRVSNGGILLLHQGVEDTIRILPQVTEILRRRGLALKTVGAMAGP